MEGILGLGILREIPPRNYKGTKGTSGVKENRIKGGMWEVKVKFAARRK